MRTRIVKIGNSRGLRIPKPLLEQTGLAGEVELEVDGSELVIRAATSARHGWESAFAAISEAADDALLDGDAPLSTSWDADEWEW